MALLPNRKSAGESRWRLFRWPFANAQPARSATTSRRDLGKRRAQRIGLNAPVFLYGSLKGEPFSEVSETLDVSANGALVAVRTRVFPEQHILLTNLQTQQDLKCRVVRMDPVRKAAALEFIDPCPSFWRIDFAPSSPR
jgi:hypothetical protein